MRRRIGQIMATLFLATLVLALLNIVASPRRVWAQGPGSLETTFNTAVGSTFGAVTGMVKDSSGNIYVAYGSTVKKLSSAGATSLTITTSGSVQAIAVDSAGNILVATYTSGLYRYTSAGALDSTFNTNSYAGSTAAGNYLSNSVLYGVAVQTVTNGRIIVASAGANSTNRLVGVQDLPTTTSNAGKVDSTFTQTSITSAMGTPSGLSLDSSNNIYVMGPVAMGYLKRLSSNGTFSAADNTFNTAITSGLSSTPTAVTVDASGNVYVVGPFTGNVKKFSSTGAADTTFNTNTTAAALGSGATSAVLQSDGKLVVGGSFTGNLKRFNTDGTLDTTFSYDAATGGTVNKAIVLSDGYILVGTASTPYIKKVYTTYVAPSAPGIPTAVAGDGQATVTVSAPTSGVTPTGYTVTAVQDVTKTCTITGASGSCTITGLTNGTSYTFTSVAINGDQISTVSAASTPAVTPVGVPPTYVSTAINTAGTIVTLTYNETLSSTTALASAFSVTANGNTVAVSSVAISGSTVQLTLSSVVSSEKTLTIAYAAPTASGATTNTAIQDVVGNDAASLTAVSFTNSSTVDQVAPIYSSVVNTSTGLTITLTYNENLSTTTALASAFTVTNGGVTIPISSVATASGTKTVVLTLSSATGSGKTVTVAYAAPSVDASAVNTAIQDVAGNDAPSFSAITLAINSSTVDQTSPVYSTGSVATNGLNITLTYDEKLHVTSLPTAGSFTVLSDGNPITVSATAIGPNNTTGLRSIVLTLASAIGSGKTVTVAYSAPAVNAATTNTAIQDLVGNDAISLAATSITNSSTVDQTSPVYSSSTLAANGLTLTLTYNETLGTTAPLASAFAVTANSSAVTVNSVAISGMTVQLTLASTIGSGKAVTVAYTAPAVNSATTNTATQDTAGNDAVTLAASSVTNSSTVDQIAPVYSSAVLAANGVTLTLTYNETMSATTATPSNFAVLVDGNPATVSTVTASGTTSTVVLTLATSVNNAATITVAYTAPAVNSATSNAAVQDSAGNDAVSFTAQNVTNNSANDVTRPTMTSATVLSSGTQVQINFSEIIGSNISATTNFTISVNGVNATITSFSRSIPDNKIYANISGVTITSNRTVTVSYTAPADDATANNAALQDTAGNDMLSVTGITATNSSTVAPDLRAPVFSSASVNSAGTILTMTYDEALSTTTAPTTAYTVLAAGVPAIVTSTTVSGSTVQLTLGTAIQFGQTVTVAYTAPTTNADPTNLANQDASGNDVDSLLATSASNLSTAGPDRVPPTVTSVAGSGSTITVSLNESLTTSPTPSLSAFTVFVGETPYAPTAITIVGSTVRLTIGTTVSSSDPLVVSYQAPASNSATTNAAIQDMAGNDAASFDANSSMGSNLWSWVGGATAGTAGCSGSNSANRVKQTTLPNGVTYSVGVTGDYLCIGDQTESLSQRGGQAGDFVATGLVTEPGVYIQTSNSGCAADALCPSRGILTLSFSKAVTNAVFSFAGWGGGSGSSTAWSEMTLITPGVTLTALSGTNMQVVGGTHVEPTIKNPSISCHSTSGYGATAQAGCGSLQINGTVTSVSFDVSLTTARGTGYVDGWNLTASMSEDFGLVPTTYESTGVASHGFGDLRMGATVAADQASTLYASTNADAVARWTSLAGNAKADDGVAAFVSSPTVNFGNTGDSYSATVSLAGVTATANLCGWIDFNRDEVFSFSERACAVDPVAGATSATITWTVPSGLSAGLTYARFRLSYETITIPTGKLASGEVEDYSLTIPSQAIPSAVNDTSINGQDVNQVISPLTNDQAETGYPFVSTALFLCGYGSGPFTCDKITLEVPGEGTYTVNSNGTVTFDPLPNYVGTATPVQYQITDSYTTPRSRTATITPTVTPASTATPDTSSDFVNTQQSKVVVTNDTPATGSFSPSSVRLCGSGQTAPNCTATTVSVTGGVYTVNTTTGVVTFTPTLAWVGTAPPVTYQAADSLGQVASSTYTPTVISVPVANNDVSSAGYDVNQTISPLSNDTAGGSPLVATSVKLCGIDDPATTGVNETETPNNCTKTSLTIPGVGTYTVNTSTGVVTFNPLPTFYGTASPITYQLADALGQYANATITPTVAAPPVPTASPNPSSDAWDTNQTINPLTNDAAGAADFPLVATTVKLCGINPAEIPNSCSQTTLVVPNEGTYTVDPTTGVVTFDPLPTFTGTVATVVKYQVSDTLGRVANSTITPTVVAPPLPTASPNPSSDAYDTNQIINPLTNDTAGISGVPLVATTVKLCGISPVETPNSCSQTSLIVSGEGTYTVNPTTGVVTFDPLPTFTGTVATVVKYQVTDALNRTVNSTITPTVGTPPAPSASTNTSSGAYDTNQTIDPLANDSPGAVDFPFVATTVKLCGISPVETPNSCSQTSLIVPGEGTYTVNPTTGVVTFDPLPTFTGTVATVVKYQVTDTLDRTVNSTITPSVDPISAPSATPETKSVLPGGTVSFTSVTGGSGLASGTGLVISGASATCLVNTSVTPNTCVTGLTNSDGTWSINQATGVVTFVANSSLSAGTKTAVTYRVTDVTGQTATSTLTPIVPPPPVASDDISTGAYDTNQTIDPLTNDTPGASSAPLVATTVKLCGIDPVQTPNNCTQTTLVVPNEGTYTVNPTSGVVTFDPVPSFVGTTTAVAYQVADSIGQITDATITPQVTAPPLPTASPDAMTTAHDINQMYTPTSNDTSGASGAPFVATTVKLCGVDDPATQSVDESVPPNCNATTLTVPGEGTYTVDPTTGVVTFDPLPSFKGTVATVVKYQATDTLGRIANSTITPTVDPPTAPTAAPETKSVLPGGTVAFTTITGGSGLATGTGLATTGTTATCLINPATTACGTGFTNSDGTWSLNQATGVVTFVAANPLAEGIKTPVTYRVTDVTGQTATSTLTPIVPPPPVANNDTSTGAYDTNQIINPLTNDKSGDSSAPLVPTSVKLCGANDPATPTVDESVAPNCNATTLVVPGEGTYTVNPTTGVVTFDPLPTFTGTATPVPYQVTDSVGRTVTATITPSVTPPPVPTATPNTGRNAYDTNQVVNPVTNDTPGAPTATFVPTSVKLCGADNPATLTVDESVVPNCNATTLVVPGEGTYTVNPTTGVVTFDPLPSFKGTATPVTYQVTDILNRTASSTITLTVDPPPAPTATPETKIVLPGSSVAFTNTTGTAGLATGTGLVTTGPTATCLFTPATTTCDSDNSVEITGVGTYVLNPATGVVTFTALSSAMSGNQPSITYRVTDITGQTATSTLTPIIPAPPAATNDVSSGPYDTNQAISPLTNDSFSSLALASKATLRLCGIDDPATSGVNETETPDNCSKTSLIVPGQGSFTVNTTTGVVTFDPEPTFVGTATPVGYQVADVLGRYVDATITPTVAPPGAPIATPETKLVLPGATITFTPITGTSGLATGTGLVTTGSTATCLFTPGTTTCDADNSITIVGEGTWTLDPATGVVTFTASATIMPGTKTPVTYRVTDVAGQTATSILTPIVPPPPAATNDTSSGPYDTNQTISPLANDSFSSLSPAVISTIKLCGVNPAQKPNDCDKTVVVVPNEGTYTLNANGTVTFDPLPTFVGTATPLGYQVQDTVGRYVNATITPTVAAPPIPAATQDTGTAKQGKTIVLTPWLNDTAGTVPSDPATKVSLVPTSIRLCPLSTVVSTDVISTAQSNPACTLTKLTTVDGTYTVDTKTGKVTFVHKKGFVGTVTQPVTYQIANNWDGVTTPQVTTSQLIPTIIGEVVAAQRIANSVSIGDKVWRDLNGNGKQGAADFGIAGVKVTLFTAKGKPVVDLLGKTVTSLRTDKDGKYLFTNLPAGQYKVVVTYPPKFRSTIPNRGPRDKDSSTHQAKSKVLALGQSDMSLGFGMVPLMTSGLAHTL
jgi:uncharacterized repeat protein (TIGR02059 family)